jgi:hypothetical protein
VVARGDAWYPIGSNPEFPLDTAERYTQAVSPAPRRRRVVPIATPPASRLAYWANWYKEGQSKTLDNGQRQLFTGSDAEVARDIGAFRALGVRHLLFNFVRGTLSESLAAMERFAAQVLPLAKG